MKTRAILSLAFIGLMLFTIGCDDHEFNYESPDSFVDEALLKVQSINPGNLKTIMDTAEVYLLLDVREPNEHDPGYIPGSVNLPRGILEFNIGKVEYWESKYLYEPLKNDLIIVYCKKGKRGILAAHTLEIMGYTNVKYLDGGFKAWEMAFPNDYERNEVQHAEHHEEVGGC